MLQVNVYPVAHTKNGRLNRIEFHVGHWNGWVREPKVGDVFKISYQLMGDIFKTPELYTVVYFGGHPWIVYDKNDQEGTATLLFCTDRVEHLFARIAWRKTVLKADLGGIIDTIQKQYGAGF